MAAPASRNSRSIRSVAVPSSRTTAGCARHTGPGPRSQALVGSARYEHDRPFERVESGRSGGGRGRGGVVVEAHAAKGGEVFQAVGHAAERRQAGAHGIERSAREDRQRGGAGGVGQVVPAGHIDRAAACDQLVRTPRRAMVMAIAIAGKDAGTRRYRPAPNQATPAGLRCPFGDDGVVGVEHDPIDPLGVLVG